jgi:hypothetical protein
MMRMAEAGKIPERSNVAHAADVALAAGEHVAAAAASETARAVERTNSMSH